MGNMGIQEQRERFVKSCAWPSYVTIHARSTDYIEATAIGRSKMMSRVSTVTLSGLLAALAVLFLVACSQTSSTEPPDFQATVDAAVSQALSDEQAIPSVGATPNQSTGGNDDPPVNTSDSSSDATPAPPTPQPTDDPTLRDISRSQHEQLDQLIAELTENPEILADCARKVGDNVPAPGSSEEAAWYAQAAITYSACAASESTGIDFTGGN